MRQGEMVKGDGRWERGMGKRGRTREEEGREGTVQV